MSTLTWEFYQIDPSSFHSLQVEEGERNCPRLAGLADETARSNRTGRSQSRVPS